MTLFFACIILCLSTLLLLSILPFHKLIDLLSGFYLFTFAQIALVLNIANLINLMNIQWFILLFHSTICIILFILWRRKKEKNSPFLLFLQLWKLIQSINLKSILKNHSFLFFLGITTGLAYLFTGFLGLYVPPNNLDSVSTHMSRIGYWLEHGNYFPWATVRVWQITYPVNGQLQFYWSVLFSRTDHFVAFAQWSAAIASAVAVAGIARLNHYTKAQSVFSGLIFLSLPAIILQSSTTQNDLIICALFILVIYFLYNFIQTKNITALLSSGIALGLGIGTKQTVLFLLPGLMLLVLFLWLVGKQIKFKQLLLWGVTSILTFLLLGSQIYISNYINFHHPLGMESSVSQSTSVFRSKNLATIFPLNASRLLYQMADVSGIPDPLWGYGVKAKAEIVRPIFSLLGLPVESDIGVSQSHHFLLRTRYDLQEDFAWYGPVGFFILMPGLLFSLLNGIKKKKSYPAIVAVFFCLYLTMVVFFRPGWDPYQGRYFMPIVAMATPLAGDWIMNRKIRSWIGWSVSIIAFSVMLSSILYNPAKSVIGQHQIWNLNRNQMLSLQNTFYENSLDVFSDTVPKDATIGIATAKPYYLDYFLFGPNFTRTVIPLYPPEQVENEDFLKENNITYLIVYRSPDFSIDHLPYVKLIHTTPGFDIYQVIYDQ